MPDRSPLIRSSLLLRSLATAVTLSSLASMSAFAATHVQNDAAPLKPAATAAPSTASRGTGFASRTTTLTGRVTTTNTAARTKTHSS